MFFSQFATEQLEASCYVSSISHLYFQRVSYSLICLDVPFFSTDIQVIHSCIRLGSSAVALGGRSMEHSHPVIRDFKDSSRSLHRILTACPSQYHVLFTVPARCMHCNLLQRARNDARYQSGVVVRTSRSLAVRFQHSLHSHRFDMASSIIMIQLRYRALSQGIKVSWYGC